MSDAIYEPMDGDESDSEIIDQDVAFGEDDGGDDALDRGYSPPERPRELDAFGTTVSEQRRGESLEQRLAQEEPDPNLAEELSAEPDAAGGEGVGGEVGGVRAGRLVAPDEGLGEDAEKDLVAQDVGIDAGAATAEEAAVHVIDDEGFVVDEGSTR